MMLPGLAQPARALRKLARRLALGALLLAGGAALADDYTDVSRLLQAGNPAAALQRAEAYLAGKPGDPQMRFLRGVALSDSGRTEDAIDAFTRLTEDYPELAEPHNNLAVLHARRNQPELALAALNNAVRANPGYATAHENLGDIHARLALEAWARAVRLDPAARGAAAKQARVREVLEAAPR